MQSAIAEEVLSDSSQITSDTEAGEESPCLMDLINLLSALSNRCRKTITAKEVVTRTVKISGVGRPFLAEEDAPSVVSVSGVTVAPLNASVVVGATTTLTFTLKPDDATDKSLRIASSDTTLATVTQKDNVATVKGVKAGSVTVVGITTDGSLVAVAPVTVTAS